MPDLPTPPAAAIAQLRRQYKRMQAAGKGTRSRDYWAGALLALHEVEQRIADAAEYAGAPTQRPQEAT